MVEKAEAGTRKGEGRAARTGGQSVRNTLKSMRIDGYARSQLQVKRAAEHKAFDQAGPQTWGMGFEAGRRGCKEGWARKEPQPSRRRQAEHSHAAQALAACGACGGGCRGEGGAARP